ncbi:MAG: NUDIX hydrolase [Hyphomicrobiaceae bacterium]
MTRKQPKPARKPARFTSPELIAVLVAVSVDEPRVLTINDGRALPSGPFASTDRSLQLSLRTWVERQTKHPVGYMEQLYTFADRDRTGEDPDQRVISISYLGLTREAGTSRGYAATWQSWYRYFPWEDVRHSSGELADKLIVPRLRAWARQAPGKAAQAERARRIDVVFGQHGLCWNGELVLQRYELLYEAGLVPEARGEGCTNASPIPGEPMLHDHRRILATGIARLRAKIKYRPVIFELMPATFTLLQLQQAVEALSGQLLHKQNFRRSLEQQDLIEETGEKSIETGGRPARLFRFRKAIVIERAFTGTKLPLARTR